MRIGIDARLDQTGVGRYTFSLIRELARLDKKNQYVLFLRKETYDTYMLPGPNFEKRLADVAHYTVAEQVKMPGIIRSAKLDLMHFPHFNVPVLSTAPWVVTIHDITHTTRRSLKSTTRDPARFAVKSAGYELALRRAVSGARKVITVSEATKQAVVDYLKTDPAKITVTYEGVDLHTFSEPDKDALQRFGIDNPYFLYVGTAYPHKNLRRLIEAFGIFQSRAGRPHQLVLAGDQEKFGEELRELAQQAGLEGKVVFPGRVSDGELAALYQGALAYTFVSLSEGFGLPGLEAMAQQVPVLAARATSLPEIYGQAAYFVDPLSAKDIARGLKDLAGDAKLRDKLIKAGAKQLARYSWEEMAHQTLEVYNKALGVASELVVP